MVLPVLNEVEAIEWVLSRMPAGYEPVVVDNGSTDGSRDLARRAGARVVCEMQRGFGAACSTGLASATDEIVCFMDCDGSLDPLDLPKVAGPVEKGAADLVLGARRPLRGAWPAHARLANRALALEIRRRTGLPITDLGPMRAGGRRSLLALAIADHRCGWPLEMLLRAAREGLKVTEVPVGYLPRIGKSKVTGTVRGTVHALCDMAAVLR